MRAPPPDFRYVGLAIHDRGLGLLRRILGLGRPRVGESMAFVPWGILVSAGSDLRVLPWSAVERVQVEVRRGGEDGTRSMVVVETQREVFSAAARGALGLESLVSVGRWANEAVCPVAIDLDGRRSLGAEPAEPSFARLLAVADEVAARMGGPLGDVSLGYRGASDADAWRAQWRRLRAILRSREIAPADARPLAALVAARVGAIACVPDLLRLVSAPSGFVALVAKAAALRLGAPLERAGGLEEVGAFVTPEDLVDATLFAVGE